MIERRPWRSAGLSLVELLIANALGAMLALGAATTYISAKQQFLVEDQLARLQENGRYALQLLTRELAMSGFYGGLLDPDRIAPARVSVDCNSEGWVLNTASALDVVADHAGGQVPLTQQGIALTCVNGAVIVPGTDVLAIKRTAAEASLRKGQLNPGITDSSTARWYLAASAGADSAWEQYRPSQLQAASGGNPDQSYWEARARVFYLRRYAHYPGDNVPTLCVEGLVGDSMATRCFVEGVEDMQFEFGVDRDGDGVVDVYRSAPTAAELAATRLVRVRLLVRSLVPLPGYRNDKRYSLGMAGERVSSDAYARQVVSAAVSLHNGRRFVALEEP